MKMFPRCSKRHKELNDKVNDLNAAENGEASEEPHGAADEAELGLHSHFHISLNLVICGHVKVDLDQLQGGERDV